jgi:hypothetical protein
LDVVKGINEVGTELQREPFGELEILVYAQVHIGVVRSAKTTELGSAIAKGSDSGVGEVAIVGEPLEAAGSSGDWGFPGNRVPIATILSYDAFASSPASRFPSPGLAQTQSSAFQCLVQLLLRRSGQLSVPSALLPLRPEHFPVDR